jgi:thymidylate synthase (FAD)
MTPYAELLEFNRPNPIRLEGFTRIRDQFPGLNYLAGDTPDRVWEDPERIMEFAGRWDYGPNSAAKLGQPIIQRWLDSGEQSMIEMGHATFFLECSRVVSHELVRHRIASYQQESQRFVKYDNIDGWQEIFYVPEGMDDIITIPEELHPDGTRCDQAYTAKDDFEQIYTLSLELYKSLREAGVAPQLARYVLPNGFRTRMIVSANIREWRHIIQLRLDKSAQPEMQQLMQQVYDQLVMVFPQSLSGVLDSGRGVR